MAFGIPAYHTEIITNSSNYSISNLVEMLNDNAKNQLDSGSNPSFMVDNFVADTIYVKSKANLWSWGEKIEIKLIGNSINITSKCALPTQIFDWGKNKQNIAQLIIIFGL